MDDRRDKELPHRPLADQSHLPPHLRRPAPNPPNPQILQTPASNPPTSQDPQIPPHQKLSSNEHSSPQKSPSPTSPLEIASSRAIIPKKLPPQSPPFEAASSKAGPSWDLVAQNTSAKVAPHLRPPYPAPATSCKNPGGKYEADGTVRKGNIYKSVFSE